MKPEGCELVDKEVAGADAPLGGHERGVLCKLLLQRVEHSHLQPPDGLQVLYSVSICTKLFAQEMLFNLMMINIF